MEQDQLLTTAIAIVRSSFLPATSISLRTHAFANLITHGVSAVYLQLRDKQ